MIDSPGNMGHNGAMPLSLSDAMNDPQRRRSLDAAMNAKRRSLGMNWADVASAADLHSETLRAIRRKHDRSIRTSTLHALDRALGWVEGQGTENVLNQITPVDVEGSPSLPVETDAPIRSPDSAPSGRDPVLFMEAKFLATKLRRGGFESFADAYDEVAESYDESAVAEIDTMVRSMIRQQRNRSSQVPDQVTSEGLADQEEPPAVEM